VVILKPPIGGNMMYHLKESNITNKIKNEIKNAAKENRWVVIKDNGRIFGSNASLNSLEMAGGSRFILDSSMVENEKFPIKGRLWGIEEIILIIIDDRG
jgi:hypothetical protein